MGTIRIAAASAVLVTGLLHVGGAEAHQQDVQVMRAGQPASISEVRESRVQVFRGAPSIMRSAVDNTASGPHSNVETVSSGSKIWFVDRATDTLSVCRLVKTTQVGGHRIECHARALPR